VTEDVNPKYERRDGEDAYEYGLRLIATKVEEQPEDLDWQDIVEALGLDCHRDSLRKAAAVTPYSGYAVMQHFKKKLGASSDAENIAYINEIEAKTLQMRKEAKRFYDQRREFNKLVDKLGREENLEDRLVAAARDLNETVPLTANKRVIPIDTDPYIPHGDEAVLVLADWHYGMVTDNIWQHYDTDVCRKRVETLGYAVVDRLRLQKPKRLHIVILGDMAHGAIHTSVRVASEELVCEQVMQVSEIIARLISYLADEVEETVVHATYGNHLRTVQNKSDSIHADNMERLIPWWLEQRLHDRGDVVFPEAEYYEFLYFDVCGYHVCATHGDLDNVRSAGRTLNTLFQKKYGTGIDYVLLADKHHKEEFEELGIDAMIVRALCGVDDYANDRRLYSTPGQLLLFFRNGVGADAAYQIRL